MKTNLLGVGALLAAIAVACLILPSSNQPSSTAPPPTGPAASKPSASPRAADTATAFVPSMQGTRPDGELRGGVRLVIDAELRYLFDYYLAALGEADLPAIRAQIEAELQRRLPAGPAAQAKRLLAQYLAYKRALVNLERELQPQANPAEAARVRLHAMQRLRNAYFSAQESTALFGASDAQDSDALARLDIAYDKSLNPAQRQARYAALDSQLTPQQRAERAAPTRIQRLEAEVEAARAAGADDNEIYRRRATALSPDAAARLAELDRETAAWQRRIVAYQAERSRLLSQQAGEAALQQLREARFSPMEQKRLGAYE